MPMTAMTMSLSLIRSLLLSLLLVRTVDAYFRGTSPSALYVGMLTLGFNQTAKETCENRSCPWLFGLKSIKRGRKFDSAPNVAVLIRDYLINPSFGDTFTSGSCSPGS